MNGLAERERVLLCVAGLSPQVITETVYALAVERRWVPDRVRVVTTGEGARRLGLTLLSEKPGWFRQLIVDYGLPDIHFDATSVRTVTDEAGNSLADIRTPQDNERAADVIFDEIRRLTGRDDTTLHVSIAGGRKTMGFYAGYALSLLGRARDHLSHVMVSPPYESSWEFFYPTPYSRVVPINERDLADTRDAVVSLARIPIVNLRHGVIGELASGRLGFGDAVRAANRSFGPPQLDIHLADCRVTAGGRQFSLSPASLALLVLFARRRLEGKPPIGAPSKEVPDPQWAKRFLAEYRRVRGTMADIEKTERALRSGMDGSYFSYCKSRLHRELKSALGTAAVDYLVRDGNRRPRRYALGIEADAIRIENGETPSRRPATHATGKTPKENDRS